MPRVSNLEVFRCGNAPRVDLVWPEWPYIYEIYSGDKGSFHHLYITVETRKSDHPWDWLKVVPFWRRSDLWNQTILNGKILVSLFIVMPWYVLIFDYWTNVLDMTSWYIKKLEGKFDAHASIVCLRHTLSPLSLRRAENLIRSSQY